MSTILNSITNTYSGVNSASKETKTESSKTASSKTTDAENKEASVSTNDTGVVFERSSQMEIKNKTVKMDTATIEKMKADAEARTAQLRSLVESMISKQGKTLASADDIWSFLAGGDFEVDAATKAQAQADIAEDGYWGVSQTSERILSFAKALSGNDPSKAEEMKEAFIKGFKEATKTWGKELPEISQKTYDAVIEQFDKWANSEAEV